jgi:hypothetical protein
LVVTPFGYRPASCVLEVEHGSIVTPVPNKANLLKVSHPTKGEYLHEVPAHCGNDIESIRQRALDRRMALNPKAVKMNSSAPQQINGWLDYGGWYPPSGENNLQSFTSTYTVPGNPPSVGNQVLFYFIGMQDNDVPNAVNIIQPVLTWGNGFQKWYLQSWACCPSNITVHSPPLFGLYPGAQVGASVVRASDSTWKIDSEFNGHHTTLNAQVGDYQYNWADVTLEVYQLDTCNQFAPGKAWFKDLNLKDKQGDKLQPKWTFTGQTACGGSISLSKSSQVYIEHKP